jgi:glutathione-specific gamma-glutamylcyclotransferase
MDSRIGLPILGLAMTDTAAPPEFLTLTREAILSGEVLRAAAQVSGMSVLSEAELTASIAATLARRPEAGDVWVFGYGSLIWNPAFAHTEHCTGLVRGWHRRFCLWTQLSRGCPKQPGLTLGLDRGGVCRGVAFRIPAAARDVELEVLWRREMVGGAYRPRWVTVETSGGAIPAIAFTINHAHERYAGKLDDAEIVRVIACAVGKIGPCSEYLVKTVAALQALGISDIQLESLLRRVEAVTALDHGEGTEHELIG